MFLRRQHQCPSEHGEPSWTRKPKKDPDKDKKHPVNFLATPKTGPGKIIKKRRTSEPQRMKMEQNLREFFTSSMKENPGTNVQPEEGMKDEDLNGDLGTGNEERPETQ